MDRNIIFILAIFEVTIDPFITHATRITINNGGYKGIVVAFSPDIAEDVGEPLIPKIKELFVEASTALYNATRQRSYFEEVTILVPQSWKRKSDYSRATFENFHEADIQIDSSNSVYGDGPYTLQMSECGKPGQHIRLTPAYLKYLRENSTKIFGNPGKTFVHEWAHLRYGVFDEFGSLIESEYPLFYWDMKTEEIRPNACSNKELKGIYWDPITDDACNLDGGAPAEHCIFIPDIVENDASSSIASFHFLPQVHTFCDNTEEYAHNRQSPNKHNALCNSRSTWEIISEHEDFKGNRNPPVFVSNLQPSFKIVQQMEDSFAFVLDVSSSMNSPSGHTKLQMLREVVIRLLKQDVKLGTAVGISTFSSGVPYKGTMKKIQSDGDRDQMISEIPVSASGMTCIGCGLQAGKQQLYEYRNALGGTIILLTDGEENQSPYIKDVLKEMVEADVRVCTIAFTSAASSSIEQLANATGGKAYFAPLGSGVQDLASAFFDVITAQSQATDLPIKISDEIYRNSAEKNHQGNFSIDQTLGNTTVINFIYKQENDIHNIILTGPNVTISMNDSSHVVIDKQIKTIIFQFSLLQPGKYFYSIFTSGSPNQEIIVTVTSKALTNVKPITTNSWMSLEKKDGKTVLALYAEVKQGNNPVVDASVLATVDRPNKPPVLVELYDNGNGEPDITRNDGIYSHYFTKFSGRGRYSTKTQVTADERTSIQVGGFSASQSMPIVNKYTASLTVSLKPTGEFERSASGGTVNVEEDLHTEAIDFFPPNKVRNLRVTNISSDEFFVVLKWTAPGDDLDTGTASAYELRYSTDWDKLFDDFLGIDVPLEDPPNPSGTTETHLVRINDAKQMETYFFALKAYDDVNQSSSVSNIAQATFPLLPTPTPTEEPPKKGFWEWLLEQILGGILDGIFG